MELMKFQIQASEQIAGRYSEYMKEPLPGCFINIFLLCF